MRLLLLLATIHDFDNATADVKGAYMQFENIQRDLPPKQLAPLSSTIWKVVRLPYGIFKAGRQ